VVGAAGDGGVGGVAISAASVGVAGGGGVGAAGDVGGVGSVAISAASFGVAGGGGGVGAAVGGVGSVASSASSIRVAGSGGVGAAGAADLGSRSCPVGDAAGVTSDGVVHLLILYFLPLLPERKESSGVQTCCSNARVLVFTAVFHNIIVIYNVVTFIKFCSVYIYNMIYITYYCF
jgi:hypothetical protein